MELHIGGQPLEKIEHTKFLGVILDRKMNWKKKPHANHISNKIAEGNWYH